jgi:hypothetical protein
MILTYLMTVVLLGQVDPEADRLLRPTLVKLDYMDQPVADVVRSLAERTGFPLALFPDEPAAGWRKKRISLTAPEPVPFWEAIDRLEPTAGLILDELHGARELRLWSDRGTLGPVSVSYDRVFRCRVASVNDERELMYGDAGFQVHSSFRRPPGGREAGGQGSNWEQFFVQIEVMSEPRPITSLEPAGPPRLIEAVDDRGQSLIPEPDPKAFEYPKRYYDRNWYAHFVANLYLKTPDPASRSIRRLKGAIPLVLWGSRTQVLTVPLDDSEGRTFKGSGVTLKILKRTTDVPSPSLELELRNHEPAPPEDKRNPLFDTYPGIVVRRSDEQFELLDAGGRRLAFDYRSTEFNPTVTRATIRLKPGQPGGPPERLRFHGLVRVETEVRFEFKDIPLP